MTAPLLPLPTELFGLHCADVRPTVLAQLDHTVVLKLDDNVVIEGTVQEIKELAVRMSLAVRELSRPVVEGRGISRELVS